MSSRRLLLLALLAAMLAVPSKALALALQPIGSFSQPIFVTSDPANPNRLFVAQRGGLIKVVQGGSIQTFADLTSVVRCCDGERGLLSMAVPPDFPQTGLFYVDYTGQDGPGNLHVAELRASGDSASIATLRNVLTIGHSQASNHNGGQLQFGPDGKLYISTGDGGATHTPAQDLDSLLGKLLRIDPRQNGSSPYSIPQSDPFVGRPGADEIWAYGFRNPWRFSFDRQTGDLLIGDVGQNTYEEVDYAPLSAGLGPGANYGWDCREGLHPAPAAISGLDPACAGLTGYTDPIFEYSHAGGGCAITGGYVARDPTLGDLYGRYVYADYCDGQIRSLIPGLPAASGDRAEGLSVATPVSFGEDSCGRLYVAEQAANVFRFTGSSTPVCAVLQVSMRGLGTGTVHGPGIDCPGDCVQVYPQPTNVVLTARVGKHSRFSGWRRACSGKRACHLQMSADRDVVARFDGGIRTRLRLSAARTGVPAGARASLRVKALPCKGRRHERVRLYRGRRKIASSRLDRHCVARFHPRVGSRSRFVAKLAADKLHRAGRSRPVTVSRAGRRSS
jgi:glucose/arabinose dehydrogenase